jgi:hypothetical protein
MEINGFPIPHLLLNVLVLVCLGWAAMRVCASGRAAWIVLGFGVCLGVAAILVRRSPQLLTVVLPFRDTIFYSNLFPYAAVLLAAFAFGQSKTRAQRVRTAVLCAALVFVSLYDTVRLCSRPVRIERDEVDENGIVRQTTLDSCSAASAATLLRRHGVAVTEGQVARLALTKADRGTHPLGLYRALKSLAPSTATVRLQHMSARQLLKRDNPAVVAVGLTGQTSSSVVSKLVDEYSWTPGVVHDVVYLGRSAQNRGFVGIAEPDFGYEEWQIDQLEALFLGIAFTLD